MPFLAVILLLVSASLHTTWNFLLKGTRDIMPATWWVVVIGSGLSLLALPFTGLPSRHVWHLAALSILTEALYFILLARAYSEHDFSLVYPLARGAAPAFLLVWSWLFLGELPTRGGWFGLSLIFLGLLLNGVGGLHMSRTGSLQLKGFASALLIALLISSYTLIDGAAVKQTLILPYALAVFALIPLPITPFILRRYGWERLKFVWNQYHPELVLIGFLGVAAYLFALWAYAIAPLNYSGAIREVTVVMGAFVGWRFLGEKVGALRLIGALVIFAGILSIVFMG